MPKCRGILWALAAAVLLIACAEQQDYWTRDGADEDDFRRTSRACYEKAAIQAFEQSKQPSCGFNTERGAVCRGTDTNNPGEVEAAKRNRERRTRYLYRECLEARGWAKNYEGRGYKGR